MEGGGFDTFLGTYLGKQEFLQCHVLHPWPRPMKYLWNVNR